MNEQTGYTSVEMSYHSNYITHIAQIQGYGFEQALKPQTNKRRPYVGNQNRVQQAVSGRKRYFLHWEIDF